jgi:hypothetical protein
VKEFSELINQMKYSSAPRILFEVCCIKACNPVTSANIGAVAKRLDEVEKRLESGVTVRREPVAAAEVRGEAENVVGAEPVEITKAIPEDIQTVIKEWESYVRTLKTGFLKEILQNFVTPCYLEDDSLTLVCVNNGYLLQMDKHLDSVRDSLSKYFNKEFNVKIMTASAYNERHRNIYGTADSSVKELKREDFSAIHATIHFDD